MKRDEKPSLPPAVCVIEVRFYVKRKRYISFGRVVEIIEIADEDFDESMKRVQLWSILVIDEKRIAKSAVLILNY